MNSTMRQLVGNVWLMASSLTGVFGLQAGAADDHASSDAEGKSGSYSIATDDLGTLVKTPDGRAIFRYMVRKPADSKLTANSVCCLFPLNSPSGEPVVEFAPADHPHHRGVFLTWHAIDGKIPADFWGWGEWAPTQGRAIENCGVEPVKVEARGAVLTAHNKWVAEGTALVEEKTTIAARRVEGVFVVDLDFEIIPKADLTLRQSAFGGLCVKGRKGERGTYTSPQGEVTLAAPHHLKPESDWPAEAWYDYTCVLKNGKTVGVAAIDHPENPPTLWHNLKDIAMVNPCIVAPGPVRLEGGRPLRLRYRLVTHDGPAPLPLLNRLSHDWRTK